MAHDLLPHPPWRVLAPTLEVVREEGREEVRAAVQDVLDQKDADLDAMSNPPREHRGVLMADIRRALEGTVTTPPRRSHFRDEVFVTTPDGRMST